MRFAGRALRALLDWYRRCGVTRVDLRASREGEPLYRGLGFVPAHFLGMRLELPAG